jgi:hypothetical protein
MKIAVILFLALITGAQAQTVRGSWFFNSEDRVKIGLVEQPGDLTSHFMNLECGNAQATGILDFDPRVLAKLVAEDRYPRLRSLRGETSVIIAVDGIGLMEIGPTWTLKVTAQRDLFEQWSKPGKVILELAHLDGTRYIPVVAYELPSEKREGAALAFLKACFRN